jgi:hypothetical protein
MNEDESKQSVPDPVQSDDPKRIEEKKRQVDALDMLPYTL